MITKRKDTCVIIGSKLHDNHSNNKINIDRPVSDMVIMIIMMMMAPLIDIVSLMKPTMTMMMIMKFLANDAY